MRLQTTKTYKKYKIRLFSYFCKKFVFRSFNRQYAAQAMLVAILMITAAALAIGLAVATLGLSEVKIATGSKDAQGAYTLAETCLENTLMRMARTDTSVPPAFNLDSGNCTIEINGSASYTITSTGRVGRAFRKIRATVSINNEVLNIESWGEAY